MVSTSLMVDTSSHPRAQLHRCVERSAYLLCLQGVRNHLVGPFVNSHGEKILRTALAAGL
jgi:hypothetical protein